MCAGVRGGNVGRIVDEEPQVNSGRGRPEWDLSYEIVVRVIGNCSRQSHCREEFFEGGFVEDGDA